MVVAATLMSVTILAIFRSVRNIIAIPSVIYIDTLTFVFWFPTRYKLVSEFKINTSIIRITDLLRFSNF